VTLDFAEPTHVGLRGKAKASDARRTSRQVAQINNDEPGAKGFSAVGASSMELLEGLEARWFMTREQSAAAELQKWFAPTPDEGERTDHYLITNCNA
jgi:hypothetical protein